MILIFTNSLFSFRVNLDPLPFPEPHFPLKQAIKIAVKMNFSLQLYSSIHHCQQESWYLNSLPTKLNIHYTF